MTNAGRSYANSVLGFDRLYAYSRSGNDTATLNGSSGDDTLSITPAAGMMRYGGGGGQALAIGFDYLEGSGGSAGLDSAYLYDTDGDDILTLSHQQQTVETTGPGGHVYGKTSGFEQVWGCGYNGGRDRVNFLDQADSSFFFGSQPMSSLYYADGTLVGEYAFKEVDAVFGGGGDQVVLHASPYFQEALSNTARDELLLDEAGSNAYWIHLHGLDASAKVQDARLQKNPDGTDQDSSSVAAIDYLFNLSWEQW